MGPPARGLGTDHPADPPVILPDRYPAKARFFQQIPDGAGFSAAQFHQERSAGPQRIQGIRNDAAV
jgi:hypothetical protein